MLSLQAYMDWRVQKGVKEILVLSAQMVNQVWEEKKEKWGLQVRYYLNFLKILSCFTV